MYRIELAPGEETVFRTIEELAVAVRNGLVTTRCRIYHNASEKWLPIAFHPHYKKALSLPAARLAEAAAPRTSGHPPRLETLSFAVAARPAPEPVAEPAPEPAAETRGDDHQAQERPEHSGAEHSGAEHSGAEHSGAKHLGPVNLVPENPVAKHPVAEHPATKHPVADHPVTKHAVMKHAVTKHAVMKHRATDHPAADHASTIPSAVLHPAAVDEATAHAAVEPPVAEHPAAEGSPSPTAHPGIEHSDAAHPWAERPAAEGLAVEHDFASPAAMAAEPPIQAGPAPEPKSKSSYRPDTYLPPSPPPSVRLIADDPFVAIAPGPAMAPPVTAEPVKPWPVMPAVPEAPQLPTISYPEFTPAEEPVAERASSSRGRRPLQVAVAILVLAAGGYLAFSFYSPVRGSHARGDASAPAAAVADRPALPEDTRSSTPSAVATKPSPDRPPVVTPTAPASSGFAAALEPRAIASGPAPILPGQTGVAQQPPVAPTTDSTALAAPIAPAPAGMQIDIPAPALTGGDSLVAQPRAKGDSAMKRILRAVTGSKDSK